MDRENARLFADIAEELKDRRPRSDYYAEAFTRRSCWRAGTGS